MSSLRHCHTFVLFTFLKLSCYFINAVNCTDTLIASYRYIKNISRCNVRHQTFIESTEQEQVVQICQGSGRNSNGNLCISDSAFQVYQLSVKGNCKVYSLEQLSRYVTVACDKVDKVDKVGNVCLPVHFEDITNNGPDQNLPICE